MTTAARTLLHRATLLHLDPPAVQEGDVLIEDGVIIGVGVGLPSEGADVIDLGGAPLMPGLVCAHTHLYSALATGMPLPAEEPASFADMLAGVWWRLDRALDAYAVWVSGLVGGVEALRAGVTTVIDHHASPSCIAGSLNTLDGALDMVGLRRILCYEVTDRGGPEEARAGLRCHEALLGAEENPLRAVMIGAHANFTLSEDTLRACGALARAAGVGLHIHVGEAADDRARTGEPLIDRLERCGALLPGSILAHCVHLSPDELRRVGEAGAWVSHQPRSNMNNHVGYAPTAHFGPQTALGTDGIGADLLAEAQAAWLCGREARVPGLSPDRILSWLSGGARLAGPKLGVNIGRIEVGAAADLVVLEALPGPPLSAASLAANFLYRFNSGLVRHVMVAGEWRLWEHQPTGVDTAELDWEAREVAPAVWSRMSG